MALDAANLATQQQFLAGMVAAQETMNNANNDRSTPNWRRKLPRRAVVSAVSADFFQTLLHYCASEIVLF